MKKKVVTVTTKLIDGKGEVLKTFTTTEEIIVYQDKPKFGLRQEG